MIRFPIVVVLSALLILNCGLGSEGKNVHKRDLIQITSSSDLYSYVCNTTFAQYFSFCATAAATTPVPPTPGPPGMGTTTVDEIIALGTTSTVVTPVQSTTGVVPQTSSATNLQLAHWCQFKNGSYIPLGYTFMYTACAICQCTQTHAILCANLQCMPTYCIDGSTPTTRTGQCCAQCAYEQPATVCTDNGVSFPQGTLVRSTSDGIQCWCQQGGIECRLTSIPDSSSPSMWGDNTASYVIIIVLCVILIFGTLICCGGVFFYYYYYQHNQQSTQEAYDQYWNSAGWQPMGEEEIAAQGYVDQKQAEAELGPVDQGYPVGTGQEFVPPPYALYNGSYVAEQSQGKQL